MRFSFLLPFFTILFLSFFFFYFQWTFSKFKSIDFSKSVLYGKDYIFSPTDDEYVVICYNSKVNTLMQVINRVPNESNLSIIAIDFYQSRNNDMIDNIIPLSSGMNTLLKIAGDFKITSLPVYFKIKREGTFKFIQNSKIIQFEI